MSNYCDFRWQLPNVKHESETLILFSTKEIIISEGGEEDLLRRRLGQWLIWGEHTRSRSKRSDAMKTNFYNIDNLIAKPSGLD